MATKRKFATSIVAGVTAAALLLGGTFAWTSISQQAKNEAIVDINPGGRLHDDFDGKNKDVYVENFGDETTGVPIFARVRLDQYFEVGQEAGVNKDGTDRNVEAKIGEDINNVETWETYIPTLNEDGSINFSELQANTNWQWKLGRTEEADGSLPYYMPTFNKNKDSLKADINGTYEGTDEGDIVHYNDFVKYGSVDEAAADPSIVNSLNQQATYDWDEDTEDETNPTSITDRNLPIDSADVLLESETHDATQISSGSTVMTMAQWIAAGSQPGPYWVYDTDGWAYWAQEIAPSETTGLLLDSINMSKVPDDNWYYGINVVGQFATASDWEMFFAPAEEGGGDYMTEDAKQLMEKITGITLAEDDNTTQTLVLTPATSNTVYAEINEAIEITYDITGYEENVESTPDISTVTVTYDEFDETNDGQAVPTPLTTDQYTYSYDPDTGMGTLTITDPNLDGYYLTVNDSTGGVRGDIDLSAPSNEPEDDGVLTLDGSNSDTVWTTHDVEIPVEFVTDGLDTEAEDYVAPDISEIKVYIEGDAEDGSEDQTLEKDTQYTYTYDEGTQTGNLTITDTTLEGYIHVTDKNGVVEGVVEITAMTALELTAAGTNSVEIDPGESVKVFSNDATADMSAIKVTYWTSFTDGGEPIYTELTADEDYTYNADTGELSITNYEISDDYRVTDNSGNVSGYVNIYYETDATTLSISYAASGEYKEIVTRGYIKPGENLMLVASTSDDQHINSEDCTWTASCGEGHPCTFNTETGNLEISNLGNDVTPHLIIVTCTYVIPETGEELYDEFHIMISDEDLIFTTTATGTGATGEALTLSTTVSTATDSVIDLGEPEWEYTITDENGDYVGESDVAAVNGNQFMAFKPGTYYVTANYGEDFLYAKTPSAIEVTSGEEMNRYYAQVETGYDDETDTPIYGNVTVGTTAADLYVIDRSTGESYGGFDAYASTTAGITVAQDEDGNWHITVVDTVNSGEYTLSYTIYGDEQYDIPDTTGTIELVIDAAETTTP